MRHALPSMRLSVLGGLTWALAMGLSAATTMLCRDWALNDNFELIAIIFTLGGFLAFPIALTAFNLTAVGKSSTQRFALAFLALLFATLGATAFVYYLQFRSYYAQWHAPSLSHVWFLQTLFTGASAGYQFAVLGSRFYLPFGLIALFGASYLLAKKPV